MKLLVRLNLTEKNGIDARRAASRAIIYIALESVEIVMAYQKGNFFLFQDRTTFRRIVLKNAFNKRKVYEQLLEGVPMLKMLSVSIKFSFLCFIVNVKSCYLLLL